jgi:phosphoribosylanthranilate isomerase
VVKICGLTRLEDVVLARDLGAWALGFVFAPSPRRLTPAAARGLIGALAGADGGQAGASVSPGREVPRVADGRPVPEVPRVTGVPLTVGVFTGSSAEEIAQVAEEVGLDAVQLHGRGGPDADAVRAALVSRAYPALIIQAVPVGPGTDGGETFAGAVARARAQADLVLLDTGTAESFGGTGTAFPWRLAAEVGKGLPLLVAGGITPDNVRRALEESGAWGVDVSSGVEASPGIKDPLLLRELFRQMRQEGPFK